MSEITIGKAKIEDALRISLVLKTVYIETYATEGVSTEFANFIEKRFSKEHIKKVIHEQPDQLFVAYYRQNPIGVAEIVYETNCPIRKTSVAELTKLYVLARFYGQGVGFALIKAAEEAAINKGCNTLNIEVYYKNDRAVSFYKRQNYQTIGNIFFQMEVNQYENFVMTKMLDL